MKDAMKRMLVLALMTALALLTLAGPAGMACAEAAAPEEELSEWTVLFYFCGSDLESKYGYASGNLNEIAEVSYPDNYLPQLIGDDADSQWIDMPAPGKVNVLIETGGSSEWHDDLDSLGLDIDPHALQRWRYNVYPENLLYGDSTVVSFELMQSLPLQSMADPQTLSDFIRWGAETCPAKKYALVLWDHGGGAKTGLFIDELFDNDVMYLYEFKQALADGGVHFETVLIDACLMANLETAWAIKDSANWLVASEEIVPGKGTAVSDWLQALFNQPALDGEWLGRCICDMTCVKYANDTDDLAKSLLTWSVVDLSKIDRLVDVFRQYFRNMNDTLIGSPFLFRAYAFCIFEAEEYGDGQQNMRDLGSLFYNADIVHFTDPHILEEAMEALKDAVVYISRGPGRSGARGLSFCYPADFNEEELDVYAKNFPMPEYLAYLDAINTWTAPDQIYEQVERLPNIDDIEEMRIHLTRRMSSDGMPALVIDGTDYNLDDVYYRLYKLEEATGEVVRLGRTDCMFDFTDDEYLFRAGDPMHWPAIDGSLCCIDLIQKNGLMRLYNIPVQIGTDTCILRCGRSVNTMFLDSEWTIDKRTSDYEIYGVWEGYDDHSELLNRSVKPLAMLAGQDFQVLYPIDADGSRTMYVPGDELTIYRALDVSEIPLPAGTYYLEYEVDDMFLRPLLLDRIEIHWDGEKMTFPEGFSWEGEVVLKQ